MGPCYVKEEQINLSNKGVELLQDPPEKAIVGLCYMTETQLDMLSTELKSNQALSDEEHLSLLSMELAPKETSHSIIETEVLDNDLQLSKYWAPADVFGKQIFLPNDPSYETAPNETFPDNIPPPIARMASCSSLGVSILDVDCVALECNTSTNQLDDEPISQRSSSKPISPAASLVTPIPSCPTRMDVCFGLINHPGTKKWRSTVDNLARQLNRQWSDKKYEQVVLHQLKGCKFWICRDSGPSKCRKEQEWREATDEEIMEWTKQRFRDCRKQQQVLVLEGGVLRMRGRPLKEKFSVNRKRSPSPTTFLSNVSNWTLNPKLNKAIEACLEAIGEAQSMKRTEAAGFGNKKIKLSDGSFEGQGAADESQVHLFQLPGAGRDLIHDLQAKIRHQKTVKLEEARTHFFDFVSCLIDYEHLAKAADVDDISMNSDP
jgi:hypothetical protein